MNADEEVEEMEHDDIDMVSDVNSTVVEIPNLQQHQLLTPANSSDEENNSDGSFHRGVQTFQQVHPPQLLIPSSSRDDDNASVNGRSADLAAFFKRGGNAINVHRGE
jgi:hypothetical protein